MQEDLSVLSHLMYTIFLYFLIPIIILTVSVCFYIGVYNYVKKSKNEKLDTLRRADNDFLKSAKNVKRRLTLKGSDITDDFFGKYCAVFFNDKDESLCIFERNKFETAGFIPYKNIIKAEYSEFVNSDNIKEVGIKLYLSEPDKTIIFPVNLITKINIREYEKSIKSAYELLDKINCKLMYETIYNKESC